MQLFAMGAGRGLGPAAVTVKVPVDAQWAIVGGDEALAGASRPGQFAVSEFDGVDESQWAKMVWPFSAQIRQ